MPDADDIHSPDLSTSRPAADGGKSRGTWRHMVDSNKELLFRKTGQDTTYWVQRAREEGVKNDRELRQWMRDSYGVTGYAQYAVSWEMFGYPDFMLQDADQLLDGQYAAHPHLRPIADAVLAWAAANPAIHIQMRKGYVSLHTQRRKFAQITRSTTSAVDVTLRLPTEPHRRLLRVRTRSDDPFTLKIRLTAPEQVDEEFVAILKTTLEHNA